MATATRNRKITPKERSFVKEYVKNGGDGAKAVLKTYNTSKPKQAAAIASKNLKKPKIRDLLKEELQRQGITLEKALQPISKALVATKKDVDGSTIDDLDTQLKGSDRALKLLIDQPEKTGSLNLNLNIDSAHFGGEFVVDGEEIDND